MKFQIVLTLVLIGGCFEFNVSANAADKSTTTAPANAADKQKPPNFNLKTNITPGEAFAMRAQDFVGQKNWKQAVAEYSKALQTTEGKTTTEKARQERNSALFMRAKCYGELHDTKKQLADLNTLVTEAPTSQSYSARARYFYDQTQYPKALADYNKAIEVAPSKWDRPYDGRGRVYVRMKDFKKAIVDLNQYCELNPKFAHAYLERANAYKQMNNLVASKKDIEAAKKLELSAQQPFAPPSK